MRSIPSKKMLASMLGRVLEKAHSLPGRVGGEDSVSYSVTQLRKVLEQWRDREMKSQAMLEEANTILDGSGVEYIASDDDDQYGAHGAYYVNMGDTYTPTILLDLDKARVYATSWGDWVESQERQGRKLS